MQKRDHRNQPRRAESNFENRLCDNQRPENVAAGWEVITLLPVTHLEKFGATMKLKVCYMGLVGCEFVPALSFSISCSGSKTTTFQALLTYLFITWRHVFLKQFLRSLNCSKTQKIGLLVYPITRTSKFDFVSSFARSESKAQIRLGTVFFPNGSLHAI